ncbi:MAG: hypothetical protein ACRELY_16605 [Polyangiaceae bacterium]
MRFRARSAITDLALAALFASSSAGCVHGQLEDPRSLPEAPRPTLMPELTHPDGEATLEQSTGVVKPRGFGETGHLGENVTRIAAEQPVYSRFIFVGGAYEAAYGGQASAQSEKVVGGNLETYVRAVWATRTGLAFGGGLGFMLPMARFDRNGPIRQTANAAIALRPWDYAFFEQNIFAARPFVDIRYLVGPVTLQVRETFDGTLDLDSGSFDLDAISTFYAAYRPRRDIALGFEAGELYRVTTPDGPVVPDDERADFTIGPVIRLIFPRLQPALSFMTNVGDPYYIGATQAWSVKTTLTGLW